MKKYKLSFYVVITDPIINDQFKVIYSTRTTKKLLLNVAVINNIKNGQFELISNEVLQKLIEFKMIIDFDENELEIIIEENKAAIENQEVLSYVIQPSADCQLGCGYCGQVHSKDSINADLFEKIIERIKSKLETSNNYKSLNVTWFGGEPLLGLSKIKQLTPKLKELATQYKCSYSASMTTNGLSLKKNIFFDLSENYAVRNFEVTLDGVEKFHDVRRHTKMGEKTFNIILNNLADTLNDRRYNESSAKISIRSNVDQRNKESVFELLNVLDERNVLKKISKIYIAPVHSWGNDAHLMALTKEEYAELEMEFYIKLLGKGVSHSSLLPTSLKQIVCISVQKSGELIDSFGNIYNCSEISQVPEYENGENLYKMDHLNNSEGAFLEKRPFGDWNQEVLDGKFPCSTCNILPICGGACPKLWHEGISPCPVLKYNAKERLVFDLHREYAGKKLISNSSN